MQARSAASFGHALLEVPVQPPANLFGQDHPRVRQQTCLMHAASLRNPDMD
jgi:hypothetical protein